ncbi:hypothetical protein ACHAXR_007049 [Thalassiosira sp. AJA248-18]
MPVGLHSTLTTATEKSVDTAFSALPEATTVSGSAQSAELLSTITTLTSPPKTTHSDSFPFSLPGIRYQPFSQLDKASQNIATSQLHYDPITWNVHGGHVFASIEKKGWMELTSFEQDGALKLGFDKETWDCFINHYNSYKWEHLKKRVKQSYMSLGWTRDHWESGSSRPSSEGKWWHQLADYERSAANGICFFADNWNSLDMNPNPSYFPYPVPEFRFRPWMELSDEVWVTARDSMQYTEQSWNNPGRSNVEVNTYYNMDPQARLGAKKLGFYPNQWDCHINHYDAYYFSSFYGNFKIAVEALGWTRDSWDNMDMTSNEPDSESEDWAELQQQCFVISKKRGMVYLLHVGMTLKRV